MRHVIVIGGGVIGLTSTWWLLRAGFRVTLLEQSEQTGNGASYRNGGQLSYRYVAPFADQGIPLKVLAWLFQRDAPLRFKPEADLRQWRWLLQFLGQCRADVNRKTTLRLLALGALSKSSMSELDLEIPRESFAWREAGKLVLYRSSKSFTLAAHKCNGTEGDQALSAAECLKIEPALASAHEMFAGGIFNGHEAVADCHAFCQALTKRIKSHSRFVDVSCVTARTFHIAKGQISGLSTSAGFMRADAYVLAAGIASRELALTAGLYLPLYPIKGYSLTAPVRSSDIAPNISVTDIERKILYARIGNDLRVAAIADLVGADANLDKRRVAGLLREVQGVMPRSADFSLVQAWAGLRPATPGGAPLIGGTRLSNLWLNVGQGPLGFTFACGSARILADLLSGKPAPIPMDGLLLGR